MRFAFQLIIVMCLSGAPLQARFIPATTADYTSFLPTLLPGDTLALAAGTYTRDLVLRNLNGTESDPIVIMGSPQLYTTVFAARSCCNTVSITMCSYLVIKNLELSGGGLEVDAVKGEGTAGNWAHHITLEYLNIVGYGADQQLVGISTKCHAWNWTIRKNRIIGAGTGLYLGNSDGDKPFVNGLIEYNLVMNTVGYNMEIKHQLDGVRETFAGTAVEGKTIIRHNVFSKAENASTGGSARPNVLLGAFTSNGPGASDVYEVYGNFFYQNPVEALLQATGNLALYANVFVNLSDPPGFRAVSVTSHNGFRPRNMWIFHNTVWALNSSGGIRLYNADPMYRQYVHANAVFAVQAISGFTDTLDNMTGAFSEASTAVLTPVSQLAILNLYPRENKLIGNPISSVLFSGFTESDRDFNGDVYDWRFRGAYSGCCANPGWKLQLDTMRTTGEGVNIIEHPPLAETALEVYPHPASTYATLRYSLTRSAPVRIVLSDMLGRRISTVFDGIQSPGVHAMHLDLTFLRTGMYFISLRADQVVMRPLFIDR